jgi:glutamyl-tRNA reductase
LSRAARAIAALVKHARDVPVVERERFAARRRSDPGGRSIVFETCHRVEGYVVSSDRDGRDERAVRDMFAL